jgi:hypothetical protein
VLGQGADPVHGLTADADGILTQRPGHRRHVDTELLSQQSEGDWRVRRLSAGRHAHIMP